MKLYIMYYIGEDRKIKSFTDIYEFRRFLEHLLEVLEKDYITIELDVSIKDEIEKVKI